MKNGIIVILSIVSVILLGLTINAASGRNHALAEVEYYKAQTMVKDEFKALSQQWGDHQEVDTLLSESQWDAIKDGDLTADQMIAYNETVNTAYESKWGSSPSIDDEKFKQAADYYLYFKKELGE